MSFTANHFQVFDLQASFEINTEELAQRYRALQTAVHPDKFANAPDQDRRLAMQKTAQINEAFQTLKNPLARAKYLLKLQDIDLDAETSANMDSEFLMTQMELREELEEIKQTQSVDSLDKFLATIEQHIENLEKTLIQQFADSDFQSASDSVRQWQFFSRLHEEALALEENFII